MEKQKNAEKLAKFHASMKKPYTGLTATLAEKIQKKGAGMALAISIFVLRSSRTKKSIRR